MANIDEAVNKAVAGKKTLMNDALEGVVDQLVTSLKTEVIAQIKKQFFQINFKELVKELVTEDLKGTIDKLTFPDKSIPSASVDFNFANMTGDQISGGTIKKFASTGIQDMATAIQLTIMDGMVVVEKGIITKELSVLGDAIIEGNLILKGKLPLDKETVDEIIESSATSAQEKISNEIQTSLAKRIQLQIKENGFDVANILVNGRKLIDNEGVLGPWIKDTRITKVGELIDLTVKGESQLSGSLYTSHNRVGINTIEPSSALSVWDEEAEIIIGKRKAQTSYIGSNRMQEVILGSNAKENIILGTAGQVHIKDLIADQTQFHSTDGTPNFASQPGAIALSITPKIGAPWGWICLGGERWGVMGLVD